MTTALERVEVDGVAIDRTAILKALKLNPSDPNTQALLVVCDRYGLDPLLKHMVLISGNPYVTRDGYLAVAHRSGVFDGMEVIAQGDDGSHYWAKVAVYRKDMGRPFTFIGRFPRAKAMAKEYGPEMAVKVAEVQALRRAFNVTGVGASDERWDVDDTEVVTVVAPAAIEAKATEAGPFDDVPPATIVRRPPPQGPSGHGNAPALVSGGGEAPGAIAAAGTAQTASPTADRPPLPEDEPFPDETEDVPPLATGEQRGELQTWLAEIQSERPETYEAIKDGWKANVGMSLIAEKAQWFTRDHYVKAADFITKTVADTRASA